MLRWFGEQLKERTGDGDITFKEVIVDMKILLIITAKQIYKHLQFWIAVKYSMTFLQLIVWSRMGPDPDKDRLASNYINNMKGNLDGTILPSIHCMHHAYAMTTTPLHHVDQPISITPLR